MARSRDMRPHGTAAPSGDGTFLVVLGIGAPVSETPEEPDEGTPGPPGGAGSGPDEPDTPLRGWIDPDDRLWRHPSEVTASSGGSGRGDGDAPPLLLNVPAGRPYRGAIMVLVGIMAVIAAVVWVIVLLSPASQRPNPGTTGDTI